MIRYQIILRTEPEGGYTVLVPSLPGCITWGKSIKQARKMAREAIEAYLASLLKHGDPVPADDATLSTTIEVELPVEAIRV